MNTKQLKLFLLVADLKSFSKAAELEALTQPAVTQQIIRLEREIGSVLFRRKHKRIELTRKGKLFYKFAKNMLSMVDNLDKELKLMDYKDGSILRIGSSHIPVIYILHKKIAEFKKMHQGSYIIYELNDTANISYMVENELIDIGFVGARMNDTLEYTTFLGDELKLTTHKDTDIPEEIDLDYLKKVPLIINQKEAGVRRFLIQKLKEYNIDITELNIISEIGLPEASLNIIRYGVGCAFIPSFILESEMKKGDLKAITIKNFNASRNYYLATKKGAILSNLAKSFLDYLTS
ncbi:MAG: LysR substrate-binding domain-containing protein [Spirochaetota bacterium]